MDKDNINKLIILTFLNIIQIILIVFISLITALLIRIIISVLIVGTFTFINYSVNNFYNIPIHIRKFKRLIHSNKNYNNITNIDSIVDFFMNDKVNSYFKLIFPIITPEVNPNSKFRLELINKRFYEFLIYDNKLFLVKLNDKEFISAKEYSDRRNVIVDKKRLKLFFKDLINKSKNPGTDYMDYIAEKKKDDAFRNIANMIGNYSL